MPMRIKFRIRPNYSAVGIMDCKVIGLFASQPVLYSPMGQPVVKIQQSKTNICVGRYCNMPYRRPMHVPSHGAAATF